MKDTAPKGLGILAIAALFGIVAAGVAYVPYEFSFLMSLFIGAIVAAIVAIVLMLGWREPKPAMTQPRDVNASQPTAQPKTVATTVPKTAAAPAAAAMASPVASTSALKAETPTKPAAPIEKPAVAQPAEAPPQAAPPMAPAERAEQSAAPAMPIVGDDAKPATLAGPRDGGADNLKQIKGVGPKLENLLHSMGFYHFDQIASWQDKEVMWVDQNLQGFKGRVSRDNWVSQAKVLAEGGETEFSNKVNKGGVY